MKVTTSLNRRELLRFNISIIPRMSLTYKAYLIVVVFMIAYMIYDRGIPNSTVDWTIIFLSSVLSGFFGLLAGSAVAMTYSLFAASASNGILGVHDYEIGEFGLSERTLFNEGITRWAGIEKVWISSSFIAFQINSYLFHIVPARSFESDGEYDKFCIRSRELWRGARSGSLS